MEIYQIKLQLIVIDSHPNQQTLLIFLCANIAEITILLLLQKIFTMLCYTITSALIHTNITFIT